MSWFSRWFKPAPAATISVTIPSQPRRIQQTLFGTNVEWVYDWYGAWDAATGQLQPDILRLGQELRPSLVRFPGGFFADYYHWRDGIGPRPRKLGEHHPNGPVSFHNFGTDEVINFAGQLGGEALITANAGSGTAQEAADWVQYAAGRVKFWEIGNELYINDGNPLSAAITVPPDVYAQRFLQFSAAMRAADPNIKLLAIGGENYAAYNFVHYPDWTRTVLQLAGSQIDYLAVHNAYAPVWIPDGANGLDVYAALLAAPVAVARNLQALSAQINASHPSGVSSIKLAVTEWGPLFSIDTKSPWVNHVGTLGSALYVASTLKAFIESPKVEIANFFKLVDNNFMGWIGIRNGQYVPKAPYFAFQLFRNHFGPLLAHAVTTSPSYNSPNIGLALSVQGVPYLESVASVSEDRKTLYLMVINKHLSQTMKTRITLPSAPRGGVLRTLWGTAIDANTGTELPVIPGLEWGQQYNVSRFNQGGPDEVKIITAQFSGGAREFEYTFPAHSVTAMEFAL